MDRTWMYDSDRCSEEFFDGVAYFLSLAIEDKAKKRVDYICCPCVDCKNEKEFHNIEQIRTHLITRGFMPRYTCWDHHGEEPIRQGEQDMVQEDAVNDMPVPSVADFDSEPNFDQANIEEDDLNQMLRDMEGDYGSEREYKKFIAMVEDAKAQLYPGCKKQHTKLNTVLSLLQLKSKNGWSDKSFKELLCFLHDVLPEGNVLPESTYEAKQVVCPLGLEVQKIHACPNDCILYRKEYEDLYRCPVCKASRYKGVEEDVNGTIDVEGKRKTKRPPSKVVWYFPIIPRLKRLFANKKNARLLRWHAEERKNDGMLRHPADGSQWRNIDRKYRKHWGHDVRNIRFALSTDGMNPFGNMSSSHSTWPVTLCIYNLPPWLCMKRKYIMMPLLIQGPRQPGNDIDVYLKPLVEDLQLLWNDGVQVWDEYKRENFTLRALLFVTISDYPALGNLSGQTTKGFNACTYCMDETASMFLKNSRKMVFMRHRRYLRRHHQYRRRPRDFDGTMENGKAPCFSSGEDVFGMVKDINIIHGKGQCTSIRPSRGNKRCRAETHSCHNGPREKTNMWKKRSVFWDLPYWKDLDIRHSIDVMHIEKNVCESCLGILLNIPGKTKDTLGARKDLEEMQIRPELHPVQKGNGRQELPTACCTLSKEEKTSLCECLHSIKVLSGYSANIKRLVSMKDLKLVGMKSHDCHVMMTQMLPVAIRGILPERVRVAIIKLCSFFNTISQKVLDPMNLDKLQNDISLTLCQLEMFFPPAFFDIMVHLMIHIVKQIQILGPVFLHQMYPFERFMSVLKKYVRNKSRPEGCIVQGSGTEEVIEFCIDYMDHVTPIGVPVSRHEGRLQGKGTIGMKSTFPPDRASFVQAHFTVLQQSVVVGPYIAVHKEVLRSENPARSEVWITKQHRYHFGDWLQRHMLRTSTTDDQLKLLAAGPSSNIIRYQGYDINGYTFYTRAQDGKSTNQNSGVRIDAYDNDEKKNTYYGFIEEIWELDYGPLKVPLFRCQWARLPGGVNIDKYGMTTVDLKRTAYRDDPFVLANDVSQVFYIKDPASQDRHVVLQGKRKIVGVEKVIDEEEYNMFDDLPPFNVDNMFEEDYNMFDDIPYIRRDHEEKIIVNKK